MPEEWQSPNLPMGIRLCRHAFEDQVTLVGRPRRVHFARVVYDKRVLCFFLAKAQQLAAELFLWSFVYQFMNRRWLACPVLLVSLSGPLHSQAPDSWQDPSPHSVQFVAVAENVRLEVLDWGGSGRPVVLLAGGGDTAHIFDEFATKLTASYHVYGITRRGFGASSFSATDDPSNRLGEDVMAVIGALRLKRPVLVGHSIAGAELSWVANHFPKRVAGLVYIDAAYSYAFDNGKGADAMEMTKLQAPGPPSPSRADLASFSALAKYSERVSGFRYPEAELRQQRISTPTGGVGKQRDFPGSALFMPILMSARKYTSIPVPALVIFANPHGLGTWIDSNTDPAVLAAAKSYSTALSALTERQEKAVEGGVPTARLVTLPGADHHVFLSNESDVVREIRAFLSGLR